MGENKTLSQIVSDRRAIDDLLEESGGDISDEMIETTVVNWISEIQANLATKSDNYQFKQKSIEALEEHFREHAKMFSSAASSLNKLSCRLKDQMKWAMLEMDTQEIQGNLFRYKLSLSPPTVVVQDQTKIPAIYAREKVILEIDKNAIKEAVAKGEEVPGVIVERGWTLRVSANKKEIK